MPVCRRQALANCPPERAVPEWLIDARRGICLLIPATHTRFDPNPNEIVVAKDSLLNHSEPRMSVSMVDAGARTLEQFAADSVAAMPGFDIKQAATNMAGTGSHRA